MASRKTTIIIISIIAFVVIVLLVIGYAYAGTPSFCGTCHIMKEYVTSWKDSSHAAKNIDCLDCHAKPGSLGVLSAYFAGLKRAALYFTGSYQKPKTVVSNNICFNCHLTTQDIKKRSVLVEHYEVHLSKEDINCADCHAQLVHKAPKARLTRAVSDSWVGAKACSRCHFKPMSEWEEAKHSVALETLVDTKQDSNPLCLQCHTVGFKKGGFESTDKTFELGNVQCENCHGRGLKHSVHPATDNIPVASLASDTCTGCHQGTHHPTGVEWENSAHAKALEGLKKSEFAEDECLICHSADYILAPPGEKPTLKEAKFAITCVTCHSSHTGELRLSREEICTNCHNAEGAVPPEPVHHPTKELFLGTAVKGSGVPDPPIFEKHVNNGVTCPDCHMFNKEFVSEQEPAISGHFYQVRPEACIDCHSEWKVPDAIKQIQTMQAPVVALLTELEPRIAEGKSKLEALKKAGKNISKIKPILDVAVFDFDFVKTEPSKGFHNPEYANAMLNASKINLEQFMQLAGP